MKWEPRNYTGSPFSVAMADRLMLIPRGYSTTEVWDLENGKSAGVLDDTYVTQAKLNECGSLAATSSSSVVKIWSMDTLQCKATLTTEVTYDGHPICCLNDRLVIGTKVWDIAGSEPVGLMDLEGHEEPVRDCLASDTHNVVLTASNDTSLRLWDLRTGECVRVMEGHTDQATAVDMDSALRTAVSGSSDNTAKLWDLGTGKCMDSFQHDHEVTKVGFHESGSTFFSLTDPDTSLRCLRFFSVATADGSHRAVKTADLTAALGPQDPALRFIQGTVAAKRDLSCFAASFEFYSNYPDGTTDTLNKIMMWV